MGGDGCMALIPAYKPGEILLDVARGLQEAGFWVLIVDDGSGEEYAQRFAACQAYGKVLRHEANRGKGRALKTGMAYIESLGGGARTVVTVDADGQHRVEDALAVCALAQRRPDALVLGSRALEGRIPLRSRFGNTMTRMVFWMATGRRIYDTQTGLRAFSTACIQDMMEIPGERYEYEMNVLLSLAKKKSPMLEHNIATIYIDGNSHSHFDVVRDSLRIYKELLKFSAASLFCFLLDTALFGLLLGLGQNLTLANVGARAVSASANFGLNRRFVFGHREAWLPAAGRYLALAAAVLAGNTLVLYILAQILDLPWLFAKVLTEMLLFLGSWILQRKVVFAPRRGGVAA